MKKIYKKERLPWGKRKVTLLGFEFSYVVKASEQLDLALESLDYFKSLTDITKLKKATGVLRDQQLKLLDFSKKVCDELNKNEINPFIIAGTLIGQLRHNGFVPWDDDVDFGLIRSEYEKLREWIYENCLTIDQTKVVVRDQKTYFRELQRLFLKAQKQKKWIAIDYVSHIKIITGSSLSQSFRVDFFVLDYIKESVEVSDYKKVTDYICENVLRKKVSLDKALEKRRDIAVQADLFSCQKTSKLYYGLENLDATKRVHTAFFEYDEIFPLKKVTFEDTSLMAPNKSVCFISKMINGDYMAYPHDAGFVPHAHYNRFENKKK